MQSSKQFGNKAVARAWIIACAFILALSPSLAQAQANQTTLSNGRIGPKGMAEGAALPVLPFHNTPARVLSGAATMVEHYKAEPKLRLAIVLQSRDQAGQEKLLDQLQDKKDPLFHKYLTAAQWNARFAPSPEDEQSVVDWAKGAGFTIIERYPNRLVVDMEAPVETIEKAFSVSINQYKTADDSFYSNDHDPVLPANLYNVIDHIAGLNSSARMRTASHGGQQVRAPDYVAGPPIAVAGEAQHSAKPVPEEVAAKKAAAKTNAGGVSYDNGFLDPTDLWSSGGYDTQALYNQNHCCNPTGASSVTPPQTSIAISAFANLRYNSSIQNYPDILGFANHYGLAEHVFEYFVDGSYTCNDSGGNDDGCVEVTLDTEWAMAMSNSRGSYVDTSAIYVYEGGNTSESTYEDVYNRMLSDGKARTFSTSWYCVPESDCDNSGRSGIFSSMSAQGWTLVTSSGDQGATASCGDGDAIQYPASNPNFVGVGGTLLSLYSNDAFYSETGWQGGQYTGACGGNNGGSTGGFSNTYGSPSYQSNVAYGARAVPDVSLNAAAGQNVYYNGAFYGYGGTSISAPMMAGFFAQENAYLLSLGGACGGGSCGPIGNANYAMYESFASGGAPHMPFYDITSGCNSNDITTLYNLGYDCAGGGYDLVTGLGTVNMLQLAWAINWRTASSAAAPSISYAGPATGTWYNTDQAVSWTVVDNATSGTNGTGIAGFTQGWDGIEPDSTSVAHQGSGDSFFDGPQYPNGSTGCLSLNGGFGCAGGVSQGCHVAHVRGWNNMGQTTGDTTYGSICYDTVAPTVSYSNSPAANTNGYNNSTVKVTLSASDPGGSGASGVRITYYGLNSSCTSTSLGNCSVYSGPISVTAPGFNYIYFVTEDVAGNFSNLGLDEIFIDEVAPVTSESLIGHLVGSIYESAVMVTLSATDNYSGVASTVYSVDGGANTTYTGTFTVSTTGTHHVTYHSVDYAGNTETTKSLSFTINSPTSTTLTSSANPSILGQGITLTAKVTPSLGAVPTGTVKFTYGSVTINTATVNSSGVASIVTGGFSAGTHAVIATYSGSTTDLTSASAVLNQVVQETTTTTLVSSLNPSIYGKSVTFTATVKPTTSGSPSGSVQFLDGTTSLGTATTSASGVATFSTATLAAGSHSITAHYAGSAPYNSSTSAVLSEKVNVATTTSSLTTNVNPSSFGESVTITATVASNGGLAYGNMSVKNNGSTIGSAVVTNGKATFSISTLPLGSNSLTVLYDGNANYNYSTSPAVVQKVVPAATSVVVSSSLNPVGFGKSVTFTATVTSPYGTPTGQVSFKNNGATFGSATISGGKATLTTTVLPVGSDSITALYDGNTDFNYSVSSAISQTVQSTTTTALTTSPNPSTHGSAVTMTAKVVAASGAVPTGTVTFKFGTTTIATTTLNSSGVATTSFSGFSVGTHSVDAVYNGSTTDSASTSAVVSQVVN